jgi:thymidine phosphorylase
VKSTRSAFIEIMDTYNIGMASLELGAGRKTKDDKIDPKAGIIFYQKIGDFVHKGESICELHSDSIAKIKLAENLIVESIQFSKFKVSSPKLIKKIIH